jgi:hypothetical protein
MKKLTVIAICAATAAWTAPAPVQAGIGVIERACRQSNRTAATPAMCRCIQRVANDSLSFSERRRVAKFFSDPHMAQVVRQSDRRSDEALWERYKSFGDRAQRTCS